MMYIPETNEELIKKCHENNFRGTFSTKDDIIVWQVTKHILINIILHNAFNDEGYIAEYYIDNNGKTFPQGHWHPENYEIFSDLQNINDNEILVIRHDILGRKKIIIDNRQHLDNLKDNIFFRYEKIQD